jgi:hypothetical protein
MDILAALIAEESKLKQQLDTVRAAIKIVIRESKSSTKKQSNHPLRLEDPGANFAVDNRRQQPRQR